MAELKGTLRNPNVDRHVTSGITKIVGDTAFKGSLAPEVSMEAPQPPPLTIKNRDSGLTFINTGSVLRPDGRTILQFTSTDGSNTRFSKSEPELVKALATPGGAWSTVDHALVKE